MVRIIGTTKLTSDGKITLIADVREKLKAKGGDVIVFEENESHNIVIRRG
jgi:bifunctional DNA-binding transcriptional regulator/antitoxin component of YhaV-PrlF toxin-antitoxin module